MTAWQAFKCVARGVFLDKGPFMPAVVGIVVYCFFYPLPYAPQNVRDLPVIVADYDASPMSRQLGRDLDATEAVKVVGTTRRVEDAIPKLQSGEIGGIVAVPPNFYRDVLRGTPTGVTVMGDGAYIVVDGTILAAAVPVIAETVAPALGARLVRADVPPAAVLRAARAAPPLVKQPLFNTVAGFDSYVVPASTGLIVHQIYILTMCILIGTWVERGAWEIAPGGRLRARAFVGMLAGFWVVVFAGLMFWIGFVFWYQDLPRAANLPGAIAFGALYSLAVVALGVALGCWIGERERAAQIIGGISIPLLFLSGFAFPVESLSRPLVWLSQAFPTTPGIQGFLKLNQMGASWAEVRPQFENLLALVVFYLALAWWAARWRARGPRVAPAPPA